MSTVSTKKFLIISILIGFLLNLTGWLGNNFVLDNLWAEVGLQLSESEWRASIWRDIFSFIPDCIYGFAIVWLIIQLNKSSKDVTKNALLAGFWISLVGGLTTYFAIANSGFISWDLAFASFFLVLGTKIPLALIAGRLLSAKNN